MPFVDVRVFDASENLQGCPASHPEELIFEVWPGTMAACDEIENDHASLNPEIALGRSCE